ncbi:hypothetical protein EDD17DRAFT_443139 [Pisolithus thermaeus]|nr:hypothetical protein EDD17DRAFT_443139 [Pisolithus thermaeus]
MATVASVEWDRCVVYATVLASAQMTLPSIAFRMRCPFVSVSTSTVHVKSLSLMFSIVTLAQAAVRALFRPLGIVTVQLSVVKMLCLTFYSSAAPFPQSQSHVHSLPLSATGFDVLLQPLPLSRYPRSSTSFSVEFQLPFLWRSTRCGHDRKCRYGLANAVAIRKIL